MLGIPHPARTVIAAALAVPAVFATTLPAHAADSLTVDRAAVPSWSEVQFSDGVAASFTASSSLGNHAISATATNLPPGLTLSSRSIDAGVATWVVNGHLTVASWTTPTTFSVTAGTAHREFTATFSASPENATAAYTGPAYANGASWDTPVVTTTLTAEVGQAADGAKGDLGGATTSFVDTNTGATLCRAPVPAGQGPVTVSCPLTVDMRAHDLNFAVYSVMPVVTGTFVGQGVPKPLTFSNPEPPDAPDPDTVLSSGPNRWLLGTSTTFAVASDQAGTTFVCRLDQAKVPCSGPSVTLSGIAQGSHRFQVFAENDEEETRDETPAASDFTVPFDDGALRADRSWKHKSSKTSFLGTCSQARRKGAKLTYKAGGISSLALVVGTGKGYGKLQVLLNGKQVGIVKTAGKKGTKLVDVASFAKPQNGTVTVVSMTGRIVRVDGLGVAQARS